MKASTQFQSMDPLTWPPGLEGGDAWGRWTKPLAGFFLITPEILMEAGIQTEKHLETEAVLWRDQERFAGDHQVGTREGRGK